MVTRSFVYQGNGRFIDVAGGYEDFERERANSKTLKPVFESSAYLEPTPQAQGNNQAKKTPTNQASSNEAAKKLTYAETLELKKLPDEINALEEKIAALHEEMNSASFYDDKVVADKKISEAAQMQEILDELYAKWEALEERQ